MTIWGLTKWLDLKLEKDASYIKAGIFEARPIAGVAKGVEIAINPWKGTTNLTVGPPDYFGVIGMDFLASSKVVLMPHLWALSFIDESTPCIVPMCQGESTKDQTLTTLQLCEEVKCGRDKDLEEEDSNKGETVKSQEVLEQLVPNRGRGKAELVRKQKWTAVTRLEAAQACRHDGLQAKLREP
uniref:Uncharacterized protein n=1 Tax=Ananas comosus var. bracteatus TaxID=296719 RepID=A0A6V7PGX1_ANACO|nr:unnamed protein product [Ananas comosus var. bracteatus]